MDTEITQQDELYVYDQTIETNATNNNTDISKLHTDFFSGVKEKILIHLSSSKKGYRSLSGYTLGHERYILSVAYKSINKPHTPGTRNLKKHTSGNLHRRKLFQRGRYHQAINRVFTHRQPHRRIHTRQRTRTPSRILH